MLLQNLLKSNSSPKIDDQNSPRAEWEPPYGKRTQSGQTVSVFSSQCIATAYRCKNIISDAVAIMPLKQYRRAGSNIESVDPDSVTRNVPYLLQISPNSWGWTPSQFKKSYVEWLLFYGNALIWSPPISPAQKFILATNKTKPVFDMDGNLWYEHRFASSQKPTYIPAVEVMHTLINPDETGVWGRGVVTFARETFGRRMAANKAQAMLHAQGFMPAAVMRVKGEAKKEHRDAIRAAYEESMSGTDNAYRLAIIDSRVEEYKPVEMQLKDSEWLESISATDDDIALFFGMPSHMLNKGKEAYNSNEQKYNEFITHTLDPILVPFEEGGRIRWLPSAEQSSSYFKFKREALLRMNAKERAEIASIKIQSGQASPNEARALEEQNPYELGNQFFMNGSIQSIRNVSVETPAGETNE